MNNNIDTGFYSFDNKEIYSQSLIHLINLYLPKNSIIVESGTGFGQTSCMIAQLCPNVEKIYTIDPYLPYTDTVNIFGKKEVENAKLVANHNIEFSGFKEKINLLNLDSDSAISFFNDESIDLFFHDSTDDPDITFNNISKWYKKIKNNGIISGHCWDSVKDGILKFKKEINNNENLSIYDGVWAWIKR